MRVVVGIVQVERPPVLEISILPFHCEPLARINDPVIVVVPLMFTVPFTSSFAPGVLVPIPTLPVASTLIRWFPSPSARMMLLERFDARPVTLAPRIVLADPVIIPRAAP